MSRANNSHFKSAYYHGNSRAIDSRLLDLTYTQFGDVTGSDIGKSGAILDLGCVSFHHSVCHHFVFTQYLENNFIEVTLFCMCIDIDLFFDMI